MPKQRLTRDIVVRAAADLLDECDGPELKLTDLAARLGVRVPSLYNHIAGVDDLRTGIALYGTEELGRCLARAAVGRSGEDALWAIAHAYRAFAKECPRLYQLTLRAPAPEDTARIVASDEILEILVRVLEPFGLSDACAIHLIRGLRSVLHGFVALELAGGFGMPIDVDASYRVLIALYIGSLQYQLSDGEMIERAVYGDSTRR